MSNVMIKSNIMLSMCLTVLALSSCSSGTPISGIALQAGISGSIAKQIRTNWSDENFNTTYKIDVNKPIYISFDKVDNINFIHVLNACKKYELWLKEVNKQNTRCYMGIYDNSSFKVKPDSNRMKYLSSIQEDVVYIRILEPENFHFLGKKRTIQIINQETKEVINSFITPRVIYNDMPEYLLEYLQNITKIAK